jgi:hypothetical protein
MAEAWLDLADRAKQLARQVYLCIGDDLRMRVLRFHPACAWRGDSGVERVPALLCRSGTCVQERSLAFSALGSILTGLNTAGACSGSRTARP